MDVASCPSSGIYLGWVLYNSSGTRVTSGSCSYYALGTLAAGAYTLVFSAGGASGTYNVNIESPQTFSATLPLTLTPNSINGVATTGAGNFEDVASQDIYSFTVPTGGEALVMDAYSCPSSGIYLEWTLYNSSGTRVTGGSCSYYTLGTLAAGAYTLVFSAEGMAGPYSVTLEQPQTFTATTPLAVTANTVNGAAATGAGNFEDKASQDIYAFTVPTGGQALNLDVFACPSSGIYLEWMLYNSAGTRVTSGSCSYYTLGTLAAGAYTLDVDAEGMSGSYSLNMEAPQSFSVTTPLSVTAGTVNATATTGAGRFETAASQDIYAFTVPSGGQSLTATLGSCPTSSGSTDATWKVLNSTGATVKSGYCGTGTALGTLAAGTYQLVVNAAGLPGTYAVTLQ
jgi:hypothetical protein